MNEMCNIDDLFVFNKVDVTSTVDGSPKPEDIDCDLSITIKLHTSETSEIFDLCKSSEDVKCVVETFLSGNNECNCFDISEIGSKMSDMIEESFDRIILLSIPSKIEQFRKLVRAISQCTAIKGGPDSFAIIKYFNGNFLSQETTCLYEDFVTPGNTIYISKLDNLLKVITNKRTKI